MGRVMAFDYGLKRTGIAVSDANRIFSFPLETVPTHTLFDFVKEYSSKEDVQLFVVGLPLVADDTLSPVEKHIKGFVKKLGNAYPDKEIVRQDERYTSKMAFDVILASGLPKQKRKDKSIVDKVSAAIILQSYLETLTK